MGVGWFVRLMDWLRVWWLANARTHLSLHSCLFHKLHHCLKPRLRVVLLRLQGCVSSCSGQVSLLRLVQSIVTMVVAETFFSWPCCFQSPRRGGRVLPLIAFLLLQLMRQPHQLGRSLSGCRWRRRQRWRRRRRRRVRWWRCREPRAPTSQRRRW